MEPNFMIFESLFSCERSVTIDLAAFKDSCLRTYAWSLTKMKLDLTVMIFSDKRLSSLEI